MRKRSFTVREVRRRAIERHRFAGLPVAEMIRRGWLRIESDNDVAATQFELARFFGVETFSAVLDLLRDPSVCP